MHSAPRQYSFGTRHAKALTALFFLLILIAGWLSTAQYGLAWDDRSEMNILRMACKEYACLLPFENNALDQLRALDLPRISESIERDHGICLYYPISGIICSPNLSSETKLLVWRLYTWTVFTAGLFALYACARRLGFGRLFSCFAVLLLLLSPRFFADGHYNNKDIPLLALTLMLIWQTGRMLEKPSFSASVGFALAAGFCAGTRIIGAALCALCGVMIILHFWHARGLNRRIFRLGLCTVLLSVMVYIIVTPSFLANPIQYLLYTLKNAVGFSRWSGSVLLWGNVISSIYTTPPRTYLPALIAVTTPVWMLILLACGCCFLIRRLWQKRLHMLDTPSGTLLLTSALCWLIPLAAGIAVRMMAYNGWRHVYFLYGPMVLCMLYGLHALLNCLKSRKLLYLLTIWTAAGCMLFQFIGICINHPYQYGYFNAFVPKENRAALFEMDYWNLSCLDALEALMKQTEGPVRIAASDDQTRSGLEMAAARISDERLFVIPESDFQTQPDYLMANLSYAAMDGFIPGENLQPFVTITSYGAPVTVIWRISE